MKRIVLFFGIALLMFHSFEISAQRHHHSIRKVVIDPGHGGKDPGAVGKKAREKDIVLSIALKTGRYISENLTDVEVIYTRNTDEFIELFRRAQIANESNADLFISIHCNSVRSPTPYGAETFVMGLHKSQDNLEVAKKENAAILLEEDYEVTYGGFDPNSAEAHIVFSLYQNAYLDQSLEFSRLVQNQFRERVNLNDRGVKQAGFLVLYKIAMPGVLIETGFLSNAKEEAFLMSEQGQSYIASAIYRAFREYKEGVEKAGYVEQLARVNTPESTVDQTVQSTEGKVSFRVQFAASAELIPLNSPVFKSLSLVKMYAHQGLNKYTSGDEPTLEAAVKHRETLVKKGYKDAFVVAFLNEERIAIDKAVEITQQRSSLK
ncbi:MAG: N-acetylmuramoyl-L-alanine amidase [Bacteroidales bacterium]|nr:N-acetylmuramoyl-L-alanine amidase [Bacteroidales bacterium]